MQGECGTFKEQQFFMARCCIGIILGLEWSFWAEGFNQFGLTFGIQGHLGADCLLKPGFE
jgi:hypothetical protein